MRAGVVHASSALLREFAPSKAAAEAAVERAVGGGEGVEGGGGESDGEGGGGVEVGGTSTPPATPSTALALVPAAAAPAAAPAVATATAPPAALSTALVPAARAALVAAAKDAKAAATAAAKGPTAVTMAGSAAVCQALRDALQSVEDPRELLDPVNCSLAVSTARRTFHEVMTGRPPSSTRAILLAADGAPWPSGQLALPEGYGLYATGLDGSDPLQVALAKFLQRYAAQAIVRCLHRSDAPLVLFKPAQGDRKGRLCLLMCVTSYSNQSHPSSLLHSVLIPQERRRLEVHLRGSDGRGRGGAQRGSDRAHAGRRRVGRRHGALRGSCQDVAAGWHGVARGAAPARSKEGRV